MRGKFVIAVLVVLMLMVPAHAEPGASTMQSEQQEDPRQPSNVSSTLYMHHDGIATAWSHFNATDDKDAMEGEYREESDRNVINVDLRFRMNPTLDKRLNMTVGEQVYASITIDIAGDYTNGDNNGPCNSDCDELNITIKYGANELVQYHARNLNQGLQTVQFAHTITEEQSTWDGQNANPEVWVQMKIKGDRQNGVIPGTVTGNPAHFAIKLGEESKVEFPIDESSWSEEFQANEPIMTGEDSPGFGLIIVGTSVAMAAIALNKPTRFENEE